jgi:hypothetical protein
MSTIPTPITRSETVGARLMAAAWSASYAALWRGDPAASAFAEWLAEFWEPSLERPDGLPDALSPHAAAGRGIEWFERDRWISGVIPGHTGGYLLPRAAILDRPWVSAVALAA